jgi:hypothetical protein
VGLRAAREAEPVDAARPRGVRGRRGESWAPSARRGRLAGASPVSPA